MGIESTPTGPVHPSAHDLWTARLTRKAHEEEIKTPLEIAVKEYERKLNDKHSAMAASLIRIVLYAITCDHDKPALAMLEEERDLLRAELARLKSLG